MQRPTFNFLAVSYGKVRCRALGGTCATASPSFLFFVLGQGERKRTHQKRDESAVIDQIDRKEIYNDLKRKKESQA